MSGSFQGFDQNYLLKALKQMGEAFCGVTQLPVIGYWTKGEESHFKTVQ